MHSISFHTFFVLVFKIVVDSWNFSMLLLYILWDDWPIFMVSRSNQQLQQELEYTLLKPVQQVHWRRRRLLRRGLEFHVCTINKSAHKKKVWKLILWSLYVTPYEALNGQAPYLRRIIICCLSTPPLYLPMQFIICYRGIEILFFVTELKRFQSLGMNHT